MIDYDVLLVSHEKDYHKLDIVLTHIKKNIVGYNQIHLIVKDKSKLNLSFRDVVIHNENDILNVDFSKFKYRPNWIYQQMLKLFQKVTLNKYLMLDSDVVVLKKICPFSENQKPIFFFRDDQNHQPYFDWMKKYFNLDRVHNYSFISEIILFDREIINNIFADIGLIEINDIINFFYESNTKDAHIGEPELYGNYIKTKFKDLYEEKNLTSASSGIHGVTETDKHLYSNIWAKETINEIVNNSPNVDVLVFHSWLKI